MISRRSPLLRKAKLRPKGLGRNWKTQLDKLCRQAVFLRDGHRCQWCRSILNIQWAHIRSRRYLSTRWLMANSLCLCAGCHLRWHQQPLAAVEWFKHEYPERAAKLTLIDHAGSSGAKIDREAIRLELMQEIAKYE